MKLFYLFLTLLFALPSTAQVVIKQYDAIYGLTLIPGASRNLGVQVTGGATNKVNWSATGGAVLSCSATSCTNTIGVVTVTMPSTGGTCTVGGTDGAYTLNCTNDVTVTATSYDDNTKSVTRTIHVVAQSPTTLVSPFYQQAYSAQVVSLQSWVHGAVDESVTWSVQSQPSGGDWTFADTNKRDTRGSATVAGRYVLKATSTVNSSTGTAIVYVNGKSLPRAVSPNKTVTVSCEVDPANTGTDYEVGAGKAYARIQDVPWTNIAAGSTVRIWNTDTTGASPSTYHESAQPSGVGGTATQPIYVCGVPDSAGNLPVQDGTNATEAQGTNPNFDGLGAWKLIGAGQRKYSQGSNGFDYAVFAGIKLQNWHEGIAHTGNQGTTLTGFAAGFWVQKGTNLAWIGNDFNYVSEGWLINNNTVYAGSNHTRQVSLIGNHVSSFGSPNSFGTHAAYIQAQYPFVEGNFFEKPNPTLFGNFMKVRGPESIIRYNTFTGYIGGVLINFPGVEDAMPYYSVDSFLGPKGDTNCTLSKFCVASDDISIQEIAANHETLAKDFVYGNVLSGTYNNQTIMYGEYGSVEECEGDHGGDGFYCTELSDKQGTLFFWNNTADQPYELLSTSFTSDGGTPRAGEQYAYVGAYLQNNSVWVNYDHVSTRYRPWVLIENQNMIATWKTNLFTANTIDISKPIASGQKGWGTLDNAFSYTGSAPLDAHMTGVDTTNFLFTTNIPYNGATFAPVTSSPLIGAGSAITQPYMAILPVRSQPDAEHGWYSARSASTTIGAMESGPQPTVTSFEIAPFTNPLSKTDPTGFTSFITFSDGIVQEATYRSVWTSTDNSCTIYYSDVGYCTGNGTGSGTVNANYIGNTASRLFTVGFSYIPLFTGAVSLSGKI